MSHVNYYFITAYALEIIYELPLLLIKIFLGKQGYSDRYLSRIKFTFVSYQARSNVSRIYFAKIILSQNLIAIAVSRPLYLMLLLNSFTESGLTLREDGRC